MLAAAFWILAITSKVHAGMPRIELTDIATLRVQNLSFFLVGFLLCAGFFQLLWNWLRKDFTLLPRLSYPKALGVVLLWGLLFVLVLTMISGARELMTPGAWEKAGATYRLTNKSVSSEPNEDLSRYRALDRLRLALWRFAREHDGRFPETTEKPEIPVDLWLLPGPTGATYVYVPGQKADRGKAPVAYEPELDSAAATWVLWTNGEVGPTQWPELMKALREGVGQ
jgi:hypothetical protein